MKPEQIYQHLKELAEKLNIVVSEENLSKSGVRVKSGLCKVRNKDLFILDKHKTIFEKNTILATFLGKIRHEHIYIVPAVREFISRFAKDDGLNEKGR